MYPCSHTGWNISHKTSCFNHIFFVFSATDTMFRVFCTFLLASVTAGLDQDYCFAYEENPYLMYGTKTAYEFVHERPRNPDGVPRKWFILVTSFAPKLTEVERCLFTWIGNQLLFPFIRNKAAILLSNVSRRKIKRLPEDIYIVVPLKIRSCISQRIFFICFVRLLALRPLLAYCVTLGW
jgi:hypothetical protein